MTTRIVKTSKEDIEICAKVLSAGGLVAFPTETVYGLGANALNAGAVKEIFKVKGRPMDNPLIAHVSGRQMALGIAKGIPDYVDRLIRTFWPGALTIIFERRDDIDPCFCAGMPNAAVRCPSHPVAHAIIEAAAVPIVAPSANLSGRPSPTCFKDVYDDLYGKVDVIVDGGDCEIGIESTVILPCDGGVRILRPGAVTAAQLESAGVKVSFDPAILNPVKEGQKVLSPGLKHRHYAPKAKMVLLRGESGKIQNYINSHTEKAGVRAGVLCFDSECGCFTNAFVLSYGNENDSGSLSHNLFKALREFDRRDIDIIYAHAPEPYGDTLGVYNRMLRAAGFNVVAL